MSTCSNYQHVHGTPYVITLRITPSIKRLTQDMGRDTIYRCMTDFHEGDQGTTSTFWVKDQDCSPYLTSCIYSRWGNRKVRISVVPKKNTDQ